MKSAILGAVHAAGFALAFLTSSSHGIIAGGAATDGTAVDDGGIFEALSLPLPNPSGQAKSVGIDNFDSNNFFGFDEAQNIVLTSPLQVNLLASTGTPGSLAAGTTVASHYLFFDPDPDRHVIATVDFDSAVLAVIASTANLTSPTQFVQPSLPLAGQRLG